MLNCDQQIEDILSQLSSLHDLDHKLEDQKPVEKRSSKSATPRTHRGHGGNTFYFDPLEYLKAIIKVGLTKIPGIEVNLAIKILSEVGSDMKKWKSEKHFTSWLGLSPENKVSGGKQLSSKTKTSANRAAEGFRLAAFSLHRSQTALGGFLRRIKSKHGAPKAITATARKISVIFYSLLTKGTEYVEMGLHYYEKNICHFHLTRFLSSSFSFLFENEAHDGPHFHAH